MSNLLTFIFVLTLKRVWTNADCSDGDDSCNAPWNKPLPSPFEEKLARAEHLLSNKRNAESMEIFKGLAGGKGDPRALLGLGASEIALGHEKRSNQLLTQGTTTLKKLALLPAGPQDLKSQAAVLCAKTLSFLGKFQDNFKFLNDYLVVEPADAAAKRQLGTAYLTTDKIAAAEKLFAELVESSRSAGNDAHGFDLCHLGFAMKNKEPTGSDRYVKGVEFLRQAVATKHKDTEDFICYHHLGEGLYRLGEVEASRQVYAQAVGFGLFKSSYQRSRYNVDRLRAQCFWKRSRKLLGNEITSYIKKLEESYAIVRQEALANVDGNAATFIKGEELAPEGVTLGDKGIWTQFELWSRGNQNLRNCQRMPKTCQLLSSMRDAVGCRRGQVKLSIMSPGTHVWPHTGPTNCRLRMHMGILIPEEAQEHQARLRCAEDGNMTWSEGKVSVFDDSFEHEVFYDGKSHRVVLIVDVWHPELTEQEKRTLKAI